MKKLCFAILFAACTSALAQDTAPATATILFKSKGGGTNVFFYSSNKPEACEGLSHTASVYDAELLRAKLLPFIAKFEEKAHALTRVYPEAEVSVAAGTPYQVLGESKWSGTSANTQYRGSCGPFTQQFTPEAGHKYLVEFGFANGGCSQRVADITTPESPLPVEPQVLQCKTPSWLHL
jgi:hypothetical protein